MAQNEVEPLKRLISGLSKEERQALTSQITHGRSPENYLKIFQYYSSKSSRSRPVKIGHLTGNTLAKAKYHVTQLTVNFLVSRQEGKLDGVEFDLRASRIYYSIQYYKKWLQILDDSFHREGKQENYDKQIEVFEEIQKGLAMMPVADDFKQYGRKLPQMLTQVINGQREYNLSLSLYYTRLLPCILSQGATGEVRKDSYAEIAAAIEKMGQPSVSIKAKTLTLYCLSFCYRALGKFEDSGKTIASVRANFEKHGWLVKSLCVISPYVLMHSLVDFAAVGKRNEAYEILRQLQQAFEVDPDLFAWRYVYGLLIVCECFDDRQSLLLADRLYREYLECIKVATRPSELINTSFYLLKLKIVKNNISGTSLLANEIQMMSIALENEEVKIYARFYEVVYAWDAKDIERIENLCGAIERMIRGSKRADQFPQAVEMLSFFKVIGNGKMLDFVTHCEMTLSRLDRVQTSLLPESLYFDFRGYLLMMSHPSAHAAN